MRIACAMLLGWKRWHFGLPYPVGLRLADKQFDGYVRRVTQAAPADSKYVRLNIDENELHLRTEVEKGYVPVSHWALNGKVSAAIPNFTGSMDAAQLLIAHVAAYGWYPRILAMPALRGYTVAFDRPSCRSMPVQTARTMALAVCRTVLHMVNTGLLSN